MARAPRSAIQGTSLIELLIAVACLGLCAAALLDLVTSARGQMGHAQRRALVFQRLEDKIDEERLVANDNKPLVPRSLTVYEALPGVPAQAMTDVAVTPFEPATYTNMYEVVVTTTWEEPTRDGRPETMTLRTLVRAPNDF